MKQSVKEIIDFWFGPALSDPQVASKRSAVWFGSDPAFDGEIRDRFSDLWKKARAGELQSWQATPEGTLALILLLDQFTRNLERGTPEAFSQDKAALQLTLSALEKHQDAELTPVERAFLLMPLQHAEDAAVQARSVAEYERLYAEAPSSWKPLVAGMLSFAKEHQELVVGFGRFPHRNRVLGRESTRKELDFLEAGARRYGQ